MSTRRTKHQHTPLTPEVLAAIERHARTPARADISVQIERQRQLERDVLRLAAELRRRGLVVQETML